jgi:hypothetical protein
MHINEYHIYEFLMDETQIKFSNLEGILKFEGLLSSFKEPSSPK